MSKPPAKSPQRRDRLAKALRANLKRRKAQSRAKAEVQSAGEAAPGDASAPPEAEPAGSPPHPRPNMAQKEA